MDLGAGPILLREDGELTRLGVAVAAVFLVACIGLAIWANFALIDSRIERGRGSQAATVQVLEPGHYQVIVGPGDSLSIRRVYP